MKTFFGDTLKSLLLAAALLASSAAYAELVKADLVARTGDGQLTVDTVTGLQWLDMRLTANQTYDSVRTGPYYAQGFRHATKAEVDALFVTAGLVNDGNNYSFTQPVEASALVTLLGATISASTRQSSYGLVGTDYYGNTITLQTHPIGTVFRTLLGQIDYIDFRSSGGQLVGEAYYLVNSPFSDRADSSYGSFLVREGASSPAGCRTAGNSPNPKCKGQARGQYK
jgi:hypothetical protein